MTVGSILVLTASDLLCADEQHVEQALSIPLFQSPSIFSIILCSCSFLIKLEHQEELEGLHDLLKESLSHKHGGVYQMLIQSAHWPEILFREEQGF